MTTKPKTAHTPGPWERISTNLFASGDNGANICSVSSPRKSNIVEYSQLEIDDPDFDEAIANARLIAAAPDLLEALQRMANEFDSNGLPMTSLPGYAKAATAKAH